MMDTSDRDRADRPLTARSRCRVDRLRRDRAAYALVARIAKLRHVAIRDVLQGNRGGGNAALARQLSMYLIHVVLSRPQEAVGLLFDRRRTTVAYACAAVEALREEDPALDEELARIEGECSPF